MKNCLAPICDENSNVLILGTMPGEVSLELQQYYGNNQNQFWKLLFLVFNEPFAADYDLRKSLLLRKHIALWDVLSSCNRIGSLDGMIKNEIPNDFEKFFNLHPRINTIVFSSRAAANYYQKYCPKNVSHKYFTLPSPSGANARKSFMEKLEEWKILSHLCI